MSDFVERKANANSLAKRELLYGKGKNDAEYVVRPTIDGKKVMCPFYKAWSNMVKRCYSLAHQKTDPTYQGCSVQQAWLTFSVFRKWMKSQQWQGNHLDKDILLTANKVYGPGTCVFVSAKVNTLMINCSAARGRWPQGVCFDKARGKFESKCSVQGRTVNLGRFETPEEASQAYKQFKSNHIISVANEPENKHIKQALIRHAKELINEH